MKLLVDDLYNDEGTQPRSDFGRVVFAIAVVGVAYHASIETLIAHVRFDARNARLAVVLALAVALALAFRHRADEVSIHDRQVDWIVGLALLLLAATLNASSFEGGSTDFLVHRVDLLSLPIFVAGITALLFGLRALGRQRRSIAYLCFAWPFPLEFADSHWFKSMTGLSAATTFVMVGIAVCSLTDGRPQAKAMWLADGIGLVWLTSLTVGSFGRAMEFVGFVAAAVAMLALLPRFGITNRFAMTRERLPRVAPFRPPMRAAALCVVAVAVGMAWLSHSLKPVTPAVDPVGSPRIALVDDRVVASSRVDAR